MIKKPGARRVFRAEESVRLSEVLRALMKRLDISQSMLGAWCGVDRTIVRDWLDPDHNRAPRGPDISAMPPTLKRLYLQEVAGDAIAVCEAVTAVDGEHGMRLWARATKEIAEFQHSHASALADGEFSDDELDSVIDEGEEALAVVRAIVQQARQQRESRKRQPLKAVQS